MRARFAENLRRCRKRIGLSQEEVAVRASIHRTEVGLLERQERLARVDTLIKLAAALEVSPCDLLDGITWEPGYAQRGEFEVSVDRSDD
ncbi:MAG TPA: helix-turn-helix transcriptional regulator [Solirubrobacterales bacterium]|nr:helix-turn-helix transcriptional regulator [Solirubrobacterales bacterium]